MREAIGTTWTFQLIIVFILIFSCFLSLVISYSKAYSLKNEVLTMIEKYEGISKNSSNVEGNAEIINNYLWQNAYKAKGKCPEGWMGALDIQSVNYETSVSNKDYYYCFQEAKFSNNDIYYNVRLFYKFNLLVLGDITTFKVEGRTNSFTGNKNRVTKS